MAQAKKVCLEYQIINNYPAKLRGIYLLNNILFNKLITKLTFYLARKKLFYLQFSLLRRTKLRISQDICYLWMTDIERIMTIFGQFVE